MTDQTKKTPPPTPYSQRRQSMDRHASVAVAIDRLEVMWSLCLFDSDRGDYEVVDESWSKGLVEDLKWLNGMLEHAIANDGDVRAYLGLASPGAIPSGTERRLDHLAEGITSVGHMVYDLHTKLLPPKAKPIEDAKRLPDESGELPVPPTDTH